LPNVDITLLILLIFRSWICSNLGHLWEASKAMRVTSIVLAIALGAIGFFVAQSVQLPPGKRSLLGALTAVISPPRNTTSFQIKIVADGAKRANTTVEILCSRYAPGAIPGRSCSPPVHVHADQAEYLEVKKGAFGFHVDGEDRAVLQPGDQPIMVLAGVPHYFWNTKADEEGVLFAAFEGVGNVEMVFGDAIEIKTMATV